MKTKNNYVVHLKLKDEEYHKLSQSAKSHLRTIAKEIKYYLQQNILKEVKNV